MTTSTFGVQRSPAVLVFGAGQSASLGRHAASLGKRALVVTDARMAGDAAFLAMTGSLGAAGVSFEFFDGVEPELPADCVMRGAAAGRGFSADMVLGIGGGSCLDAAKTIAVLLAHGGQVADYYGEHAVPGPILPLIAVPTTAGTGSEVTPVAVLSDSQRTLKIGIASPHLIPRVAICDPELTHGCPTGLTAVSGADALTHAIEAFTTLRRAPVPGIALDHVFLGKNALSDHHAREAIRLIGGSLGRVVAHGADRDAREAMMLGATLAGLAFGVAGTAAAHAIQYPVGALTHTAHGAGVACVMPYVMEFNRPAAERELAEIAVLMGFADATTPQPVAAVAAVAGVRALFASIGIPVRLKDMGLAEDRLEWCAEMALGAARLVKNNPRSLDGPAMLRIVRAAWDGSLAGLAG